MSACDVKAESSDVLPDVFGVIEGLREDGWLVVLKCVPNCVKWVFQGSVSEFDAPCPDRHVGGFDWACEVKDMETKDGHRYRGDFYALAATPDQAVKGVVDQISSRIK